MYVEAENYEWAHYCKEESKVRTRYIIYGKVKAWISFNRKEIEKQLRYLDLEI